MAIGAFAGYTKPKKRRKTRCGEIVALRWGFLDDPLTLLTYTAHLQSIHQSLLFHNTYMPE